MVPKHFIPARAAVKILVARLAGRAENLGPYSGGNMGEKQDVFRH